MYSKLSQVTFFILFSVLSGLSQYNSGVTVPDKSIPKVTNDQDASYRFASGISPSTLRDHMKILASADKHEARVCMDYLFANK